MDNKVPATDFDAYKIARRTRAVMLLDNITTNTSMDIYDTSKDVCVSLCLRDHPLLVALIKRYVKESL